MGLTHEQAWQQGTNIRTALRLQPEQTRAAIMRVTKGVVDFVDAKRTLNSVQDIMLLCEAIITNYPTLKLEELARICEDMKMGLCGKFYERLKVAEFFDAINAAEGRRADFLEAANRQVLRGLKPGQHIEYEGPETLGELMARRSPLLSTTEKEERRKAKSAVDSGNGNTANGPEEAGAQ